MTTLELDDLVSDVEEEGLAMLGSDDVSADVDIGDAGVAEGGTLAAVCSFPPSTTRSSRRVLCCVEPVLPRVACNDVSVLPRVAWENVGETLRSLTLSPLDEHLAGETDH